MIVDNEVRSAKIAVSEMKKLDLPNGLRLKVKKMIEATSHKKPVTDSDEKYLIDLDLAILGKSEAKFLAYQSGIRQEYDWVSQSDFCKKRREFVLSFLDRPSIYTTDYFRAKYENTARSNLKKSIEVLEN
jgi:predicted metal-dependent HD superfamily phosphohydrolase